MGTNWSFTSSPWTATVRSPRTWEPITTFARSCRCCQKDIHGISRTSMGRTASSTMVARGPSSPSGAMTSSWQPILSFRTQKRSGWSTSRQTIPRQPEVPVPRPPRGPSRTGFLLNSFLPAVRCAAIHAAFARRGWGYCGGRLSRHFQGRVALQWCRRVHRCNGIGV